MVDGVVSILVEPTGHNAPARSRTAGTDRNNLCAGPGEPFRERFTRTVQRLQACYRLIQRCLPKSHLANGALPYTSVARSGHSPSRAARFIWRALSRFG